MCLWERGPQLGPGGGPGRLPCGASAEVPRHQSLLSQVCSKRERRLADPALEKYVLTVVLDTISAFFSSPFSENSTSLQVSASCWRLRSGESQNVRSHVILYCVKMQQQDMRVH